MIDIGGKNILVTGAGGFLGAHICEVLSDAGAEIYCIDKVGNPRENISQVDITDEDDINQYLYSTGVNFSGIVNNAAVIPKGDITPVEFLNTMNVNVVGTRNIIQQCKDIMEANASIVNIASIYGILSPDFRIYDGDRSSYNASAYGASKAAVVQLTKYCAAQLAPIRVNSVSPGGIYQNHSQEFADNYAARVPLKRMAEPKEIANVIMFLLSPLSSYITGTNIVVDGGLSVW